MKSVLSQLNFLKYSKDDFYIYKSEFDDDIILLDNIEQKINLIRQKISKNAKSSIQNSFEKIDKKSKFARSWRITATVIKKKDLSELEKYCNEINSYLNKLSPQNFDKISSKVIEYLENENNTSEMLKELIFYTINNIFKKAVTQPVYCPYYVKLLNILDKKFQIRDLIDKKCADFKNVTSKNNTENNESIDKNKNENETSDAGANNENEKEKEENSEQRKYDEFCEEIKSKKFIEGYSQFIGELYKNNMIKYETLDISILMFFDNLFEELDVDCKSDIVEYLIICLCKLYTTIKGNIKSDSKKNFLEKFSEIKDKGIIKRLQFKLMDIIEGR